MRHGPAERILWWYPNADLVGVNNAITAPYNIFADMNGDGIVNVAAVQIVRARASTTLP